MRLRISLPSQIYFRASILFIATIVHMVAFVIKENGGGGGELTKSYMLGHVVAISFV